MSARQLHFRTEARERLLRGAQQLADAVRVTLGPRSRSVLIQRKWGRPLVCDDGVTIAKEVRAQGPRREHGRADAARAGRADPERGRRRHHHRHAAGPRHLLRGPAQRRGRRQRRSRCKRGIERAAAVAIDSFKKTARPVQSRKEKARIATISAHGNTVGRRAGRRRHRARGQRGRDHRRGSQGHPHRARGGGGHAVRQRLPVRLLRQRPREDGVRAHRRAGAALRQEDLDR